MLHITEHTGRGVPRIIRTYGRDTIKIKENTIQVTIPFDRLGIKCMPTTTWVLIPKLVPKMQQTELSNSALFQGPS